MDHFKTVSGITLGLVLAACSTADIDYREPTLVVTNSLEQGAALWQGDYLTECPHLVSLKVGGWYGQAETFSGYTDWITLNGKQPDCLARVSPGFLIDLMSRGYIYSASDILQISTLVETDLQRIDSWLAQIRAVSNYDQELIQRLQVDFYRKRVTLTQARFQTNDIQQHLFTMTQGNEQIEARLQDWQQLDGQLKLARNQPFGSGQLDQYREKVNRLKQQKKSLSDFYSQAFFN